MNMQKGAIAAMAVVAGMSGIPAVSLVMPTVALAATETGTVGTCPYSYDSTTKTLTIGEGTLPAGTKNSYMAVLPHSHDLTTVKFTGKVTIPSEGSCVFYGCSALSSIENLSNLDTSKATDMGCMFWGCSGLTSLDLKPLKTDNVTSMNSMFAGCSGLTSLDLTPLKTDNVTSMNSMFRGCSGLTSLDLTPLKTDNVTDMSWMFSDCSGLTSLDLTPLKTDNVTDMSWMFRGCSGLTSLDLTPLNTENVTNMFNMFHGCSGLTSLRTGDTFGIKATSKATLPKAMTMDGTTAMTSNARLVDGAHYYLTEGTALPDAWKPQHVTYNQKFDSKDSTWSSDSDIHDGKVHLFYSTLGGKWQDPGQDATVDTDNHDHDNGTYLVTIPTKIAYENMNIGKVDTSDSYTVNVRGAIEDGQTVTVTAETGNKLKNGSFEDITETTTQGKTTWTSDEVFSKLNADGSVAGTDTTDNIKMSGEVKSAGKYEGVVGYSAKLA